MYFACDLSWDVVWCVYVRGDCFELVRASVCVLCVKMFVGGVFGLLCDVVRLDCLFFSDLLCSSVRVA